MEKPVFKNSSRIMKYSLLFFACSIFFAVMGRSNTAFGDVPGKVKGPIVENCVTVPDSVVYAFATDCTGTGLICVDTECPSPCEID